MNVCLKGHDFQYEVGELLKAFVAHEKINFVENALVEDQSILLVSSLSNRADQYIVNAKIIKSNGMIIKKQIEYKMCTDDKLKIRKMIKGKIKLSIYDVLSEFYNTTLPWGILTGIRPTKIVHELMNQGLDMTQIEKKLKNDYRMGDEKINLVMRIAQIEKPFIHRKNDHKVSIYVSIPFCPTRCIYCSFPSNPLDKGKNQIKEYLEALIYEITETGKILKECGKKVESLYIGGGTPTTLNALELETLIKEIKEHIDLSYVKEITVEAGRPDTITKDKLMVLKREGVNRISINPQTMNQKTLDAIGRSHVPQDIVEAYDLAKQIGFDAINMDIIVGLPGENAKMVEDTMKEIEKLDPQNLTVHTLAVKKTSRLREHIEDYPLAKEEEVKKMLEITSDYAKKMALIPYYMYRQKYMLGNLENIGYCKPDHECIYNIQIMEEKQSIIALGAGAVSKIYYEEENRLERVPNVTNLEQYIERVEEMIARKRKELSN
ncbi:coproporphyrinogen dehydrogenase HemZ [Marinisporobacter balticus]|uniref:Oxygen-independent coproporphyrinogen-3 oxidase n=1 Tax=Marinisporobacter balticus TaxID=2018667 RepID=A0A4R2LAN9_9FIRM|nr:coproporphyrinogen dehydrogenase HemZ [Marinisporobacter balticus]TCO79838.1 oxygen-independent coproporphyrinogen-3 oxidase [Marinisporobacter balticus]